MTTETLVYGLLGALIGCVAVAVALGLSVWLFDRLWPGMLLLLAAGGATIIVLAGTGAFS